MRGGIDSSSASRYSSKKTLAPTLRGPDETFTPALKGVLAHAIGSEAAREFSVEDAGRPPWTAFTKCGMNCVCMAVEARRGSEARAALQRIVTTHIRRKNAVRVLESWFDRIVWRPGSARSRALKANFDMAVDGGV